MKIVIKTLVLLLLVNLGGCDEDRYSKYSDLLNEAADNCFKTMIIKQKNNLCIASCTNMLYPISDWYLMIVPCPTHSKEGR